MYTHNNRLSVFFFIFSLVLGLCFVQWYLVIISRESWRFQHRASEFIFSYILKFADFLSFDALTIQFLGWIDECQFLIVTGLYQSSLNRFSIITDTHFIHEIHTLTFICNNYFSVGLSLINFILIIQVRTLPIIAYLSLLGRQKTAHFSRLVCLMQLLRVLPIFWK